jgi:hypothetical protein
MCARARVCEKGDNEMLKLAYDVVYAIVVGLSLGAFAKSAGLWT